MATPKASKSIVARFRVEQVIQGAANRPVKRKGGEIERVPCVGITVKMAAERAPPGEVNENDSLWSEKANGTIELQVMNLDGAAAFEPNRSYRVTFEPV